MVEELPGSLVLPDGNPPLGPCLTGNRPLRDGPGSAGGTGPLSREGRCRGDTRGTVDGEDRPRGRGAGVDGRGEGGWSLFSHDKDRGEVCRQVGEVGGCDREHRRRGVPTNRTPQSREGDRWAKEGPK